MYQIMYQISDYEKLKIGVQVIPAGELGKFFLARYTASGARSINT